jgi:hypothetical protein
MLLRRKLILRKPREDQQTRSYARLHVLKILVLENVVAKVVITNYAAARQPRSSTAERLHGTFRITSRAPAEYGRSRSTARDGGSRWQRGDLAALRQTATQKNPRYTYLP